MKTDLVLTMGEYLAMCCHIPKHVIPAPRNAHHIPITAKENIKLDNESGRSRCDRWEHPCSGCIDQKQGQSPSVQDFANKEPR